MSLLPEVEHAILDAVRRDQRAGPSLRRRFRWRPVALIVGFAAVALSVGALAATYFSNVESAVRHGQQPLAPSLSLPAINSGHRISLASYRGQVVVLSFWASWCEPCRREAPDLAAVNRELHSQHAGTVLIDDVYDSPMVMRTALARLLPGIPAVRDPTTPGSASPYGINGLPSTFIINRQGRVTAFRLGQSGATLDTLNPLIKKALSGS
jgi:cytochrome c biogenesis protein CcmG/thiol:disulfide interchange protein DsbE